MLTPQQILFVQEYLKTGNAYRAAINAGYTPNTARKRAYAMLRQPAIKQCMDEARAHLVSQMRITLHSLMSEYVKIAFFDVRNLFDKKGRLIPLSQLDAGTAGAVTYFQHTARRTGATVTTVRISDKLAALNSICKLLGFRTPPRRHRPAPPAIFWIDNTGDMQTPRPPLQLQRRYPSRRSPGSSGRPQ